MPKKVKKYKVRAEKCKCEYLVDGPVLPWTTYTCKVCGAKTNLLRIGVEFV